MALRRSLAFAGQVVAAIGLVFVLDEPAQAAETKVVVRAKAKDAMFIGTSIGGRAVLAL